MGVGCLDEVDIGAILPRTAGTYDGVLRPAVGKLLAADNEPQAGVKPGDGRRALGACLFLGMCRRELGPESSQTMRGCSPVSEAEPRISPIGDPSWRSPADLQN